MYETIKYEVENNIGYVTINRPKAMNALNTLFWMSSIPYLQKSNQTTT